MRLLLTSSGKTNKSIEKALLKLLGKPFEKAKLTFVPTAANIEKGDKTWLVDDMNNFRKLNFALFDIIDISLFQKLSGFRVLKKQIFWFLAEKMFIIC